MHIALFSPAWPLGANPNGIVTYVHWLADAYGKLGHRVSVFTPKLTDDGLTVGVYQIREGWRYRLAQRVLTRLKSNHFKTLHYGVAIGALIKEVHRQDPIDIIEMEESFGWCSDVQRVAGLPVVVKLHGPAFLSLVEEELESALAQARIEAEGAALTRVSGITSPCDHVKVETARRYGLKLDSINHIENPINPLDDPAKEWKQSQAEAGTILFVGRFDKRKGGDIAVQAFSNVLREQPSAKFIFVGPDYGLTEKGRQPIGYAEYAKKHLSQTTTERISFMGSQDRATIEKLRLSASLVFTASRWENQSYTGLEAMRQGCPLICVDSGGQAEIIQNGVSGLIAEANSPVDLAQKIVTLLNEPDYASRLGMAGKKYVEVTHSPERVAELTMAAYRQVLS